MIGVGTRPACVREVYIPTSQEGNVCDTLGIRNPENIPNVMKPPAGRVHRLRPTDRLIPIVLGVLFESPPTPLPLAPQRRSPGH